MTMNQSLTVKKLVGHSGCVSSIALSPGGDVFATGAEPQWRPECEVRIWDVSSGENVRSLCTGLNGIFSIAISPDCCRLAVGGGGLVSNGRWVYTGGIAVWTLDGNQRVARFGEELRFIKSMAFSPDGVLLLTCNLGSPNEQPTAQKKRIRLWHASDFKEVSGFGEHAMGISSARFSPNGRYVAFGSNP